MRAEFSAKVHSDEESGAKGAPVTTWPSVLLALALRLRLRQANKHFVARAAVSAPINNSKPIKLGRK